MVHRNTCMLCRHLIKAMLCLIEGQPSIMDPPEVDNFRILITKKSMVCLMGSTGGLKPAKRARIPMAMLQAASCTVLWRAVRYTPSVS